jgi:biopolymer transport protein ExbD
MHISEPTPARRRISLTPLVDVIFLLLMFFMLSSTFARFADLDVARQSATPGEAGPSEPAALRGAIVSVSADMQVRVNGADTEPDDIAATLDALYDRGARTAIVVTDYRATVQDLVSVLERARQSKIAVAIAQ